MGKRQEWTVHKNGEKAGMDGSQRRQCPSSIWENAQIHSCLETYELKQHRKVIFHPPRWQNLLNMTTNCVCKAVEKQPCSYIAGGNVNWNNPSGEKCGNTNTTLPLEPGIPLQ